VKIKQRSAMRPGEMFGTNDAFAPFVHRDVLIVVDGKTEVSFWTGALYCWGDVGPALEFEVIA
jgi:hypothetical protein